MLDEILTATRARVAGLDTGDLRDRVESRGLGPARSFEKALSGPGLAIIAEVKRRSPSRGALAPGLDPMAQAARYEAGGASAVSVLTEPSYFAGSLSDLEMVAQASSIPVLRKDFVVAAAQIWESVLAGADAVLLIVAALSDAELADLLTEAGEAGLDALVEVHTASEADRAVAAGARIVGVNNRDLATFEVDLRTAEDLAPRISGVPVRVAESGVHSPADAGRMAAAGYSAVLVGEALVTAPDPGALVAGLRTAGTP